MSERVTTVTPDTGVLFEEKLRVPLRWWVQATMFLASIWLAFVVALPAGVAWAAVGVLTASVVALFLGYGSATLRVADGVFHAGRASIPAGLLANPVALDAQTTRRLIGVDANAHAYLLLRPYLKRSVQAAVSDASDPVPYWLVSTRRPDELVAALRTAASRHG
ncbi:MAG TPA: DUF3093 domain-containing protein [Nocardioidaceae bacterium]|nr:DUF3093 domain-containing protein [Nocardioidaceae bacterium]